MQQTFYRPPKDNKAEQHKTTTTRRTRKIKTKTDTKHEKRIAEPQHSLCIAASLSHQLPLSASLLSLSLLSSALN